MIKTPLIFEDVVVGFIEDIQYQNNVIDELQIHIFNTIHKSTIIEKIKMSDFCITDKYINDDWLDFQNKYDFIIDDDILKIKMKK